MYIQNGGKQFLISVIVPVYNVEDYLDKCIKSIINQTYSNMEIILVDDGSTDKSSAICDSYRSKDHRIIVVHKENGGLSSARNVGIEMATGDFLGFVDSDDYIDCNMYRTLVEGICDEEVDMCVGGIGSIYANTKGIEQSEEKVYTAYYDGEEAYRHTLAGDTTNASVCSRIFRKETLGSIRFPEGKYFEDVFFLARIMPFIRKAYLTSAKVYFYYHRENSITTEVFSPRQFDIIDGYMENLEVVRKFYPELEPQAKFRLYWGYFIVLERMIQTKRFWKIEGYDRIVGYLREHWLEILRNPHFQMSRKIATVMLRLNVWLYVVVFKAKTRNERLNK